LRFVVSPLTAENHPVNDNEPDKIGSMPLPMASRNHEAKACARDLMVAAVAAAKE
jgi:hypothetical protein